MQNCDTSFVRSYLVALGEDNLSLLHGPAMQSWGCITEYLFVSQQEDLADCDHEELEHLRCGCCLCLCCSN